MRNKIILCAVMALLFVEWFIMAAGVYKFGF